MMRKLMCVLLILLLSISVVMANSREYGAPVSKGFERTYKVTKAMDAKFYNHTIKKGDTVKVHVGDIKENTIGGDKYSIVIGDIYINNEKIIETHNLTYPSAIFFIYPDMEWINDHLKPAIEAIGGSIKISDDGEYVEVTYSTEVDIYVFTRTYIWKNGILEYLHELVEVGGEKISELEFGKKEIPIALIVIPLVIIGIVVVFVIWKKILAK